MGWESGSSRKLNPFRYEPFDKRREAEIELMLETGNVRNPIMMLYTGTTAVISAVRGQRRKRGVRAPMTTKFKMRKRTSLRRRHD
jgi:hypothetical protein